MAEGRERGSMMNFHKIWNLFVYAGLEKEEYNKLLPDIREKNRSLLRVFSLLGTVMFFLLYIASLISGGFATSNSSTYLACGAGMLLILACAHFVLPKQAVFVMSLVYVFEILLYAFGIHVSMLHAEKAAVSAVAFLLVSPLLFYDRPARMSAMIAAVVVVFSVIVAHRKEPDVAETDIWNMITFGIVAVATTVFTMSVKFQAIAQSGQIEYISQTDLLTGAKNRNHYENRLQAYPDRCANNLICVYADVNGLHEMNNQEGHPAGDRMLREVAEALRKCFDPEHIYRVGGDEFIAFQADGQPDSLTAEIDRMKQDLDSKGYHVSFGIAVRGKAQGKMDMQEMVNEAESNMFANKREYYRQSGNDRRSRR